MIQARDKNRRPEPAGDATSDATVDFRLIAEYARDWIFAIDDDGRFAYVSPACTEITGHTPANSLPPPG